MEGGIDLAAKAVQAFADFSFTWSIDHAITKKHPDMLKTLEGYEASLGQTKREIGVLMVVGCKEWTIQNGAGNKLKTVMDVMIGGVGGSAADVYESFIATPRIVQGAPKGWTRSELYTWATRNKA